MTSHVPNKGEQMVKYYVEWGRSQLLNLVPEIGSKVNKLRASPYIHTL